MIEQEVEVAIALVIRTPYPGFWKDKEVLAAGFGERAKDIKLIRFHNFGVPRKKNEPTEVKIEIGVVEEDGVITYPKPEEG